MTLSMKSRASDRDLGSRAGSGSNVFSGDGPAPVLPPRSVLVLVLAEASRFPASSGPSAVPEQPASSTVTRARARGSANRPLPNGT